MLKLLRFYKPFTWSIVGIFALTILQVGANLALPTIMSDVVDVGIVELGAEAAAQSSSVSPAQVTYFLQRGGLMLLVAIGGALATIASGYLASRFTAGIAQSLRSALFARVERFSFQEYDRFSAASLIIRNTADVAQIQQASFMLVRLALIAPFTFLGAVVAALSTNLQLSWVIGITIPLILVVIAIGGRYVLPLFRQVQEKADHLNLVAREGLTGVRVIRAFNRQPTQRARFTAANDDLTDTNLKVSYTMVALMPSLMLILQFASVAIIWVGANLIDAGSLQIGDMMAFLQYAAMMLMSIMMLMAVVMFLPRANVAAERIAAVLETEPAITDAANPVEPDDMGAPSVELRDVTFYYDEAEEPSLSNVSFTAAAGTTTAIIGSTGSGKTTILNLIERLYDTTEGEVLVNGHDVRDYRQADLRGRIGYIPQKTTLFSGTVRSNLAMGREDATDEEMWSALEEAQAEFIRETGEGLEAAVTQGGTNFSGGQRQRLTIARALVRRPDIYLFDDSFSALDLRTDSAVRRAIVDRTRDAVVIVVAQRITTIKSADQILVLENGAIVGRGTHDELIESSEVYREIAASQLTEEELAR